MIDNSINNDFQAYHARIGEVNSQLNAVTELNPDALQIAASLDAERRNDKLRRCVSRALDSTSLTS
jgi:Asp-tRNA(Asn)/Glu-tRNA(Gln) amidotransferase A subunit family amidase